MDKQRRYDHRYRYLIMNNVITKLEIQKRDKNRVNVYLDEVYSFSISINAAALLHKGQPLDGEQIRELKGEDETVRAYSVALRFLGFRARSCAEMEKHLSEKKFPKQVVKTTISRLLKDRYLDDRDFSRQWLESRSRFKPKSAYAISYELKNKGIEESVISDTLEDFNEFDAALHAVDKKRYQWEKLDKEKLKKKLFNFLGNRGFSYETAWKIFNRIGDNN